MSYSVGTAALTDVLKLKHGSIVVSSACILAALLVERRDGAVNLRDHRVAEGISSQGDAKVVRCAHEYVLKLGAQFIIDAV